MSRGLPMQILTRFSCCLGLLLTTLADIAKHSSFLQESKDRLAACKTLAKMLSGPGRGSRRRLDHGDGPQSTESTTGLPLGLPDDVFNQVLEYLDGHALLASQCVDRTGEKHRELLGRQARPGPRRAGPRSLPGWRHGPRHSCRSWEPRGSRRPRVGVRRPACQFRRLSRRIEQTIRNLGSRRGGGRPRRTRRRVRRVADAVAAVGLGSIEGLYLSRVPSRANVATRFCGSMAGRQTPLRTRRSAPSRARVAPPCVVLDVGATASIASRGPRGRVRAAREGATTSTRIIHAAPPRRLRRGGCSARANSGHRRLNKAEEAGATRRTRRGPATQPKRL